MDSDISYDQMKARIGSLIFLWSCIERTFRAEIMQKNGGILPKSAHGIAASLDQWQRGLLDDQNSAAPLRELLAQSLRKQLEEPLKVRNGICHGLVGISASGGNSSASLTFELNGVTTVLTFEELDKQIAWLNKVPRAVEMISLITMEGKRSRMDDNAENRAWWHEDIGLNVL